MDAVRRFFRKKDTTALMPGPASTTRSLPVKGVLVSIALKFETRFGYAVAGGSHRCRYRQA
jgi:hypothetical protein